MSDTQTFTSETDTLTFLLAGNARVTFQSLKTGTRYTYRVRRAEDKGDGLTPPWFVSLLTGSDNESDYTYMGLLGATMGTQYTALRVTRKSRYTESSAPVVAFRYVLRHLTAGAMPPNVAISHEGRCGRCGRALTVPSSIASGLGPECAGKMGL